MLQNEEDGSGQYEEEDGSGQYKEDGEPSNASTSQNLKTKGHVQQHISGKESNLSVDLELAAHHTDIPTLVLQPIWFKATDLLSSINISTSCGNLGLGLGSSRTNLSSSFPIFSPPCGTAYPLYYPASYVPSLYNPPGLYNTPGALPLEDMMNRLDSFPLGSSSRVNTLGPVL